MVWLPKDTAIQGIVLVVVLQLRILELPCWQVQRYEQYFSLLDVYLLISYSVQFDS